MTYAQNSTKIECMVKRLIESTIHKILKRPKSILLLGPRQTGKTTLIRELNPKIYLNLAVPQDRRRFELDPELIIKTVHAVKSKDSHLPLLVIDEIQKVPALLDPIQTLIDDRRAIFVLTGSSARKLRKQSDVNLLPGRVVSLRMDPLMVTELNQDLSEHLLYGSLPGISTLEKSKEKSQDLRSYVDTYLEEEVRAESLVRNLPAFYRFLELAALESGRIISFNSISQEIGAAHTTVSSYFEILEDCLVVERIDPITASSTRKKLMKSSKYVFFDHGVRRFAAQEGSQLGRERLGELFESFIGIELVRQTRGLALTRVQYWRDADGPEVDWVLKTKQSYIPIETKLRENVGAKDTKRLTTFMNEYPCPHGSFVVCNTPLRFKVSDRITAIPWRELETIVALCE